MMRRIDNLLNYFIFILPLCLFIIRSQSFMFPNSVSVFGKRLLNNKRIFQTNKLVQNIKLFSDDNMNVEEKKLTPRMKRIANNIELYKSRKDFPKDFTFKILKLPKSFHPKTASFNVVIKSIEKYEKAGHSKMIYNLCKIGYDRNILGNDGGLLLRSIILSLIRLHQKDLAIEVLTKYSEENFITLINDNKYSFKLYSFIKLLCRFECMKGATFMIHKFELIGEKQLLKLIESRKDKSKFENDIVSTLSSQLSDDSKDHGLDLFDNIDYDEDDYAEVKTRADDDEEDDDDEDDGANEGPSPQLQSTTPLPTPWHEYLPLVYASMTNGYMKSGQELEAAVMMKKWRIDAFNSSILASSLPHNTSTHIIPNKKLFKVSNKIANSLLNSAIQLESQSILFDLLDTLHVIGTTADDAMNERLVHAMVQSISFKTGAVSLETLPKLRSKKEGGMIPEVAFIGRSNVGKSSLINYVVGRRALAYTSKKPGKTQQFNYFIVNEDSKWERKGEFHLVDLPGVGYAKVPKPLRNKWSGFMQQFMIERPSLKVVFHLIDSRHGAVAQDSVVMSMMAKVPARVKYVIILTKADKKLSKLVLKENIEIIKTKLKESGCFDENNEEKVPIVLTSSLSRLGRNDVWRYLRTVVEPDRPPSFNK